jgi:uncharacterized protein (DUF1800 family)
MAPMNRETAHAMVRFGLGPRGREAVPLAPKAWLAAQLDGADPALAAPCHSAADGLLALREVRQAKGDPTAGHPVRDLFRADSDAAVETLLTTATPFRERLVWFWANHFTVSIRRATTAALAHAFVRDAIRPHVTGRFADMLLAVMRHPAMLLYLDNAVSIGPDSTAGLRRHVGLNENLGRECLELHTVTPASGYTQADVTGFARVLTGWSVNYDPPTPGFLYRANTHEPGDIAVLGRTWPSGEDGGVALLGFLAAHKATRHNLATKLVRHFVADVPPPAAVARIEAVLNRTDGDLNAASLALLDLPEAWQPLTKLRTPFDYVVAVLRALDLQPGNRPDVEAVLNGLGQGLFGAPLPNGWADTATDWAGPEALMRRVDWAYAVAGRAPNADPESVAAASLGDLLPTESRQHIARAPSRRDALAMLFASPEFQRR